MRGRARKRTAVNTSTSPPASTATTNPVQKTLQSPFPRPGYCWLAGSSAELLRWARQEGFVCLPDPANRDRGREQFCELLVPDEGKSEQLVLPGDSSCTPPLVTRHSN